MLRGRTMVVMSCLAASLMATAEVHATVVEAMSLEDMSRRADAIFIGRCVGVRAEWNLERTRIYTYVTLEVERYLKGEGEGRYTLRLLGGQVGPYRLVVPGVPRFAPGEDALVFSAGAAARVPTVLGWSLGKFTLSRDDSGERILKRDISSLMLANHRTDARALGAPPTRFRLSEVEARIARALNP